MTDVPAVTARIERESAFLRDVIDAGEGVIVGQRPLVGDYVVSVGVLGQVVTDTPSDWVPALGAIPTFKWVRGSQVRDVHPIAVIEGGGRDAEVTVGVYEAFTTAGLSPLDERIARLGRSGVGLGQVTVR